MNLLRYAKGCWLAVNGDKTWLAYLPISRGHLRESFLALAAALPSYYIGALAIAVQRTRLLESGVSGAQAAPHVPLLRFALAAGFYLLSFTAMAFLLAAIFRRKDRLIGWITLRHWSHFFMALIMAAGFGLFLLGVLPFAAANSLALGLFLGTLALDIRLAQVAAGFDWVGAVFAGCVIALAGLLMISAGLNQLPGGGV